MNAYNLEDSGNQPYKVFREHTIKTGSTQIDADQKNTKQGFTITDQSDTTGEYTVEKPGSEEGWGYTAAATGERNGLGAYSQVHPAILKTSDSKVYPIVDKTLAIDTEFAEKSQDSTATSDATKVRVAEDTSDGVVGLVVNCLSDKGHQQIFFQGGAGMSYIIDLGDGTGKLAAYDPDTDTWAAVSGATAYDLKTFDPLTCYHDSTPPWLADRIYLGRKLGDYYFVDLQGFGNNGTTISRTTKGVVFTLDLDNSGKVIDFTAEEEA